MAAWPPQGKPYICPECGRNTRVNRKDKEVYSHTRPGSATLCLESGRIVESLSGADSITKIVPVAGPAAASSTQKKTAKKKKYKKPVWQDYPEESGKSVRAIPRGYFR